MSLQRGREPKPALQHVSIHIDINMYLLSHPCREKPYQQKSEPSGIRDVRQGLIFLSVGQKIKDWSLWKTSACEAWLCLITLDQNKIRLMEEILHHLGCIKPCKKWCIDHINWLAGFFPSTVSVSSFQCQMMKGSIQ